jgi:hypothetical protein
VFDITIGDKVHTKTEIIKAHMPKGIFGKMWFGKCLFIKNQSTGDCLLEVTAWAGLTVFLIHCMIFFIPV